MMSITGDATRRDAFLERLKKNRLILYNNIKSFAKKLTALVFEFCPNHFDGQNHAKDDFY